MPERFRKRTPRGQTTKTEEIDEEFFEAPYGANPDCPICKGSGFVYPRNEDNTIDYSRVIPCNQPGCYGDQAREWKESDIKANRGEVHLAQTFDNFDATVPGVQKAFKAAQKIAEKECDFNWLLLYGGVGNGKTHLLNAIANRAMNRLVPTHLLMMADLLSELRMAMETNQVDFRMDALKRIPFLLIDELGLEYGTGWEKEKIEELLASRWNRGLRTIVATNRDISELPERLQSRFKDRNLSRYILNEAPDYREKKGGKRWT